MVTTTRDDVVAPESSQVSAQIYRSNTPPTTETEEERFSQLEEADESALWWNIAFVSHNSQSINDSFFIWFRGQTNIARSYDIKDGMIGDKIVTSEGNSRNQTIAQLLSSFCQTMPLPMPVPDRIYDGAGVLATILFQKHQNVNFKSEDLPFAIRGVTTVDPEKHIQLLGKKFGQAEVPLSNFGDLVRVHADEGMLALRGLVNFSVMGIEKFAFVIIAKVDDKVFTDQFGSYPSFEFTAIIGTACYIFHRALAHINNPDNHTEAAVLARQIGQAVYEESVREVDPTTLVPTSPRRKPKNKTKKKRSKKSKKGKKPEEEEEEEEVEVEEKVEAEAGEEESQVENVTVPTITVDPPSPKQEEEPTAASSAAALPSPPRTNFTIPTITMPVTAAFSFSSPDPRLVCRLEGCTIVASAAFPSAMVCPRCTPYSYMRYCSRPHLFADLRRHFITGECGSTLIPGAVDDTDPTSIPTSALPLRPYIQESHDASTGHFTKNILERHRQACYRAMSRDVHVDYYVFDDIDRIDLPGDVLRMLDPQVQKQYLQDARGKGRVCATVELAETDTRKVRFTKAIEACLRLGVAAGSFHWDDCAFMFGVLKGELGRKGEWDVLMEEKVAVQMGFEFGWQLPVEWREA